jgi:hypothetical protein
VDAASWPSRSSLKFSMILWMTVIIAAVLVVGFRSFGRPWVAHRVWARPIAACGVRSAIVWNWRACPPSSDEEVAVLVGEAIPAES